MLSKKQYWYTLIVAIILFFLFFSITYFYTKGHVWQLETPEGVESNQAGLEQALLMETVTISPQTKVILKMEDTRTHKQSQTRLESTSLLGLTESDLQKAFEDYTIETFNEKEVTLVKNYYSEEVESEEVITYVLSVEGNYVCIKEKDTNKRPVKIDYEITHFSKYIYSLLLNEEVIITSAQKEALLLNPSTLQKILQGYVGE